MFHKTGHFTQKIPVIFPTILSHKDVAEALISVPELKECTVTSAGEISPLDMVATGKSITLQLESAPNDTEIIQMIDYFFGIETLT